VRFPFRRHRVTEFGGGLSGDQLRLRHKTPRRIKFSPRLSIAGLGHV
jgi:hypothetical protein